MADELELDLDLEDQNLNNRAESRIKDLSSKVRDTAKERDEAKEALEAAAAEKAALEKERDFFATFTDTATKFPGASEYKDAIKEKVLAGYSVEDATVAVLNAEGKLAPQVERAPEPAPAAAGGSAPTNLPSSGTKVLGEMTRDEKRAEVEAAIGRGDIFIS
jgi:hypothetical protein